MAETKDSATPVQQQATASEVDADGVPTGLVDETEDAAETEAEETPAEETTETTDATTAKAPEAPAAEPDKQNVEKLYERLNHQVNNLNKQMTDLTAALVARGGQPATPAQEEAIASVTEQLSDIDKRLAALADDDFVDGKTIKAIYADQRALREQVSQLGEVAESVQMSTGETEYWKQFDKANPELATQHDALVQQAEEVLARDYADVTDPKEFEGARKAVWRQIAATAKAAAKTPAPTPAPAADPKAATPAVAPKVVQPKPGAASLPRSAPTPVPPRVRPPGASVRSTSTGNPTSSIRYDKDGVPMNLMIEED